MSPQASSRKRAVNLSLSDHLVEEARQYSENLSATVDELLAEYVHRQHKYRENLHRQASACAADWNTVHDKIGSFADEHSTL